MISLIRRPKNQFALAILTLWLLALIWIWSWRHQDQPVLNEKQHEVKNYDIGPITQCQTSNKCEDLASISCHINDQVLSNLGSKKGSQYQKVDCLFSRNEVYVPTSFVKEYFDIYGDVRDKRPNGSLSYSWSHSYSKVFPSLKDRVHSVDGPFLQFAEFEVENRPRVKCVTASEDVPISTQWRKEGYYYSTQISQYALSHWSKHVLYADVEEKSVLVLEDGQDNQADWDGYHTRVLTENCVLFDSYSKIKLDISDDEELKRFMLSFSLQYKQNVTITVGLKSKSKFNYFIKYVAQDFFINRDGNVVYYGYGAKLEEGDVKQFTRNLLRDLQKVIGKKSFNRFVNEGPIKVASLSFEGVGCVTNVTLSNQEHLKFFMNGAEWLVRHQDSRGGWPVNVIFNKDNMKYPGAEEIPPGWYSAMAQGHALSVLSRAYTLTKGQRFLNAALKGLNLFHTRSQEGGFSTKFLNTYNWYEEYPTNPSTFVLNGFMYSLLGLHDLISLMESFEIKAKYDEVAELLDQGVESLQALLPLFDMGSKTAYDLRHFTMKGSEPKLARWDYHSTHINLLYALSSVLQGKEKDFLLQTAERWKNYMIGKTATHN